MGPGNKLEMALGAWCWLATLSLCAAAPTFPASQLAALRDLFNACTEGGQVASPCFANWDFERSSSENPCSSRWVSLRCNAGNTSITEINLFEATAGACDMTPGYLPTSLGAFHDLTKLQVPGGQFQGSIPEEVFSLSRLQALTLARNVALSGTLSRSLCNLASLRLLVLQSTSMSGPLPWDCFPKLNLSSSASGDGGLFLSSNRFSGTISPLVGKLSTLPVLDISLNRLSGTVPSEIGGLTTVQYLSLAGNLFTGIVPWQLGRCVNLKALNLRDNMFVGTGPLPQWPATESGSLFASLQAIEASYNLFSGQMNSQMGQLQSLKSLLMQSTCLSGTLPPTLCRLPQLRTLVLVGLSDNAVCQDKSSYAWMAPLAPGGQLSTVPGQLMQGGVPPCLFGLPSIDTIFISGLGLEGPVEVPALSPSLQTLSLSRNRLSGPLPVLLQRANLSTLDLSFNKLTGNWVPDFVVPRDKLDLSSNFFSGDIPDSFYSTLCTNFRVLSGNLLKCRDGTQRPQMDPSSQSYTCGDSELLSAMYLWLACFGGVVTFGAAAALVSRVLVGSAAHTALQTLRQHVFGWLRASTSMEMHQLLTRAGASNLKALFSVMRGIRVGTIICIIAIVFILLPFYPALKSAVPAVKTYQDQQAWIVSAAFLRGSLTCDILWAFLLLLTLILARYILPAREEGFSLQGFLRAGCCCNRPGSQAVAPEAAAGTTRARAASFLGQLAILAINAVVIFAVNLAYIERVDSNSTSAQAKNVLQLAIAVFRVAWASALLPAVLRLAAYDKLSTTKLRVILDAFNAVILPGVSNLHSSKACFYDLLHPVTLREHVTVELYGSMSTDYIFSIEVPFFYSDACGSSMILNFVPILIYSSIIDGFLRPLLALALSSAPALVMRLPAGLRGMLLERIFWVHLLPEGESGQGGGGSKDAEGSKEESGRGSGSGCVSVSKRSAPELFDAPSVVADQVQNLLVLLTYGFSSPVLALALALAVTTQTLVWQAVLGRHLARLAALSGGDNEEMMLRGLAEVEAAIGAAWRAPKELFWYLVFFSFLFWAMLMHDFVADAADDGSQQSAIIVSLVVAFVSPLGVFVCTLALPWTRGLGAAAWMYVSHALWPHAPTSLGRTASFLYSRKAGGVGVGRGPSATADAVVNPLVAGDDHIPVPIPVPVTPAYPSPNDLESNF